MEPRLEAQADKGADVSAKLNLSVAVTDEDLARLKDYTRREAEWARVAKSIHENLARFREQMAAADPADPRLTAVAGAADALAAGWTDDLPTSLVEAGR